jgi:RNA-directed DNA polymerase
VNTDDLWPDLSEAESEVLRMQAKLHQWATDSPNRRFSDLYNLVSDPALLVVAWHRVRGNRGARSAGVDGVKPRSIVFGNVMLAELREDLKARRFKPLPVKERMIPKTGGKLRRLGIPTTRDRVVQASLKLVLEPIFEADFKPCSYGFRPMRRAQDAIAEIHHFTSRSYVWVLEGDITACFDEISHTGLMDRVRNRIGDRHILDLVKAFLKSGLLNEGGQIIGTKTGTPQGGILSPLLANVALSVLDEYFATAWESMMATQNDRQRRRYHKLPNYRLVRYADDFVVLVSGTEAHAEELKLEVAAALVPMGLHLSEEKTTIVHIDDGFDFLGFRIQRQRKPGTNKRFVYTWPSRKSLSSIMAKVKAISRQGTSHSLSDLLSRLNPALRGWTTYFRYGVSKATFEYLSHYTWWRVLGWLRRKVRGITRKQLRRRYLGNGWRPQQDGVILFHAAAVSVSRYRYRAARIPTPWDRMIRLMAEGSSA